MNRDVQGGASEVESEVDEANWIFSGRKTKQMR